MSGKCGAGLGASLAENKMIGRLKRPFREAKDITMITPTNSVTVKCIKTPEDRPPQAEVINTGSATGVVIDGANLEAALQVEGGVVLILNNDCPMEESLDIHYLDHNFTKRDQLTIFMMYGTGVFSDLRIIDGSTFSFSFFKKPERCQIRIRKKPAWRIPFSLPSLQLVTRPMGTQKWMDITTRQRVN